MTGNEQRCPDCGELNPERARFCLGCGKRFESAEPSGSAGLVSQLPQAAPSGSGERRMVSVLFADLSGFTAYSEGSDVEDVRAIATQTADRLGEIVVRYGGTVDKIIGDCVMAVWGAPAAHEDDPERAVRAALEMQDCVEEHRQRFAGLALCAGIQTGEAMWAPVGPDGRYTVLGDTVNTAARLQGAAAKGEVVIGRPTFEAVAHAIDLEEMEPINAKNKADPVPAWRAVGVKGRITERRRPVTTLFGRDHEFSRLRELWDHVTAEERTYGVALVGAPGVGKTRLVEEFTNGLGDDALVLRGRCLPYGDGITYWPVIEMIHRAADIKHDDDRTTVSTKLGDLLESLGSEDLDELRTMAVALANLIGSPTTPRGTYSAAEISRGELHWGLRRILQLGSRVAPLVIVFEDLQWAEPTLIELIASIFDAPESARILAVATGRPEFKEGAPQLFASGGTRRTIELATLEPDATQAMIADLCAGEAPPDDVVERIVRSAGGNPLFVEQVIQMWRESDGDAAPSPDRIPDGLQALIDSRLDRLAETQRQVLARAAVIGDVFWERALAALCPDDADLDDALASLAGHDYVRPSDAPSLSGGREYAFTHGMLREAAYRRLPKKDRGELHSACGRWIAGLPGGQDEYAEIIAYHLEQACRLTADLTLVGTAAPKLEAARALNHASQRAEAREGMAEAERFLARSIDLLGDSYPETAIEAKLRRGRIIVGLGRIAEAKEHAEQAATAAANLGRTDIRCRALITLAELDVQTGAVADAQPRLDEGERIAKDLGDAPLRIRALQARGTLLELTEGPTARAVETLQAAIALAEETGDNDSAMHARLRLGASLYNAGDLSSAQFHFERCEELARIQGSLRVQSWLTGFLGLLRFYRGPRDEARPLFERSIEWLLRTNDAYMEAQTRVWHADLLLETGDVSAAVATLRGAQPVAGRYGGYLAVVVAQRLAEAFMRQGRVADAKEAARTALEQSEGDMEARASALIAESFALAASGDVGAASRAWSQAFPILEERGNRIMVGQTRLAVARLLEAAGDLSAAADQLERARARFDEVAASDAVVAIDLELARLRDAELSGANPSADRPGVAPA